MSDMTEENHSVEMDTSTYSPAEKIIAQIMIEQNTAGMDGTTTYYIPVETTGQIHSGQLDTNSAYSLLEKTIAQSMTEQSSSEMDTSTTYITVETTTAESMIDQNHSEQLDANSAFSLLEKTIVQSKTDQSSAEMDTTTTYIAVETTAAESMTGQNHSEQVDTCSQFDLLVANSVQNLSKQNSSGQMGAGAKGKILERKTYVCNICDTVFCNKLSLSKHLVRLHGAERMRYFSCAYCARSFKIRKNLHRHMQLVHAIQFPEADKKSHQIFLNEDDENSDSKEVNEWVCKSKDCIRRKKNVLHQGMQTGCQCIPPKELCLFCKKDQPVEVPETDDSECICFENFFEPEKTFSDAATETGCGSIDCRECDLCPKFDIWNSNAGTGIQCIECNISFVRCNQLRNHLKLVHKHVVDYETHHFPDMTAFRKWKYDVERKDVSNFIKRHGVKKTTRGLKYFFDCHRSGKYNARIPKQEKMKKNMGSMKLGIICTAAMYCEENADGVVVKYWPHHYGHGKETSFVQISPEEQAAIQENVSNGISVENLLDDIRDHQSSSDQSQLYLMKKRDIRFINNAYDSVEYNPGLSDAESVDQWVHSCCQMEESPILFYRQEFENSGGDFLLIIMTEFQKQILMSSDKQVVCVDSFFRQRGGRFYLTVLSVMDECEIAFPVTFCISGKVNKDVITQFFTSIKQSTGPLDAPYFMSDNMKFYYDAWLEVMNVESKWLWCLWYVDNRIKIQLRAFKSNKRVEVYNTMQVLMECQNETVFQSIFKNYLESVSNDPLSKSMSSIVQNHVSNAAMWAYCYRKEVKASTNLRLEAMHHTFRYCCREGRKKRLDKFIFVIMKLLRYKMLDRLTNVLDEENMDMAVEAINMCHDMGLEISTENISSLSDKIWLIRSEEEGDVYVTCDFECCPENCKLKCSECDICVHMYSCSCMDSMINANLCQHIHAIAWKFLTPHFSPSVSPVPDHYEEMEDTYSADMPIKASELLERVLKRAHDVYKKVRAKKCDLKRDTLTNIMTKLNECVDLCSGKTNPEESANQLFVSAPYAKEPVTPQPIIHKLSPQPSVPTTSSKKKETKYLVVLKEKDTADNFVVLEKSFSGKR